MSDLKHLLHIALKLKSGQLQFTPQRRNNVTFSEIMMQVDMYFRVHISEDPELKPWWLLKHVLYIMTSSHVRRRWMFWDLRFSFNQKQESWFRAVLYITACGMCSLNVVLIQTYTLTASWLIRWFPISCPPHSNGCLLLANISNCVWSPSGERWETMVCLFGERKKRMNRCHWTHQDLAKYWRTWLFYLGPRQQAQIFTVGYCHIQLRKYFSTWPAY